MKQVFISGFVLIILSSLLFKGLDLRPPEPKVELLLLHYSDNPKMDAAAHRLFKLNWHYSDKGLLLLRYHPSEQSEKMKANVARLKTLKLLPTIKKAQLKKGSLLLLDCQPSAKVIDTLSKQLPLARLKKRIEQALQETSKDASVSQKKRKK